MWIIKKKTEVVKASPNPRTEGRARLSRTLTAPVYIFVPQACGVHSVLTCVTCFQERHGKREGHFWRERWQHSCRLAEKEEGRERVRRGTQTGGGFQSLSVSLHGCRGNYGTIVTSSDLPWWLYIFHYLSSCIFLQHLLYSSIPSIGGTKYSSISFKHGYFVL